MEKKTEEAALKLDHNELTEKVKLLEAVVQNMFQNLIRLDREVGELRNINKSKDISEKASIKQLSIKEKEYQSKEETTPKEGKKVTNPKLGEFKEDKLNDHLKCDKCEYSCKKSSFMIKHMNTKHGSDHVEKEYNSTKQENTSTDKNKITGKETKTLKVLQEKSE